MDEQERAELKKRILEEMTLDYYHVLKQNFDLARHFIQIRKDGTVEVSPEIPDDKLSGRDRVSLYLLGKLYAKEGGLAATSEVGSKELLDQLGVGKGSLFPWLKDLRDNKIISQTRKEGRSYYSLRLSSLERILRDVDAKVKT